MCVNDRGGQGQARVIQEVTNCVVIKTQSQYSLTDLEPPPCELSNDVGINLLGRLLQEVQRFPHVLSDNRTDFSIVWSRLELHALQSVNSRLGDLVSGVDLRPKSADSSPKGKRPSPSG